MSATPRSTRREFLQGQAAADALAAAIAPEDVDSGTSPPTESSYLLHVSRRAMACTFELFFNAGQYPHATEAALAALDLVDRLEDQLSVYREHSEISQINRRAGQQAVPVERSLFDLLVRASRLCQQTAGAYDITAAPLSEVWGFTRRNGAIPSAEGLRVALARVGSQFMELDDASSSVSFARPGLTINLGSIGKGYALDHCADVLAGAGIHDYLLHGGNSSVLARGVHGSLAPQQGWAVGIRNPLRPSGGWDRCFCGIVRSRPPARARNSSCTTVDVMATSLILAAAGRPRACCRSACWLPLRPRPTRYRPPST